jgi:hypothetical protein
LSVNRNGNLRPDGISFEPPWFGLGGTYYWRPGAPAAPSFTLTGGLGKGGGGAHLIHLRKGMSSEDTTGYGASINLPSFSVNASIPDKSGISEPWNAKVSSIGIGAALPGLGVNYTVTPAQVAAFIRKYIMNPIAGPVDQPASLSSHSQPIRLGAGTERSIPNLGSPSSREPPASRTSPWPSDDIGGRYESSVGPVSGRESDRLFSGRASAIPYVEEGHAIPGGLPGIIASVGGGVAETGGQVDAPAGGLLGIIQDYLLTQESRSGSR